MKKAIRWLLCLAVLCCIVFLTASLSVRAEEDGDAVLIHSFYSALNDKDYAARAEMAAGDYYNMLVEITGSELYVQNRLGFYNVASVNEVEILGSISATEYPNPLQYAQEISTEYEAYLVMSDITAYEDTEFYFTGTRFDVIIVGTVEDSRKIISMNTALDSTVRNYMQEHGISAYISPVLTSNFCIPKTITVKLENGGIVTVDFKEYCQKVACEEVGYNDWPAEYHKAGCIALKNYACYCIMTKVADTAYHIEAQTENGQVYNPNTNCSQWPNLLARLDEVWHIFVVDSVGGMVLTEYRSGTKDEHQKYNKPSSGVMLQSKAYTQARDEHKTYTEILEYAYNNSQPAKYAIIEFKWIDHVFEQQPDGNYKCKKCGEYQGIALN